MFHPASTCRIGAPDDAQAVVDPECRVYGVEGLRVADASVMPCIVSANTNLPAIMIGERVAEFMRRA
jgi:choline dehydrogenase